MPRKSWGVWGESPPGNPRKTRNTQFFTGSDPLTIGVADGEPRPDVGDLTPSVLCIADGELYFWADRNPTAADVHSMAEIPKLSDSGFWNDFHRVGETLRVDIPKDRHDQMRKSAAKDGWFLTADYSTKPPRVVLTKAETKYSHWVFVRAGHPAIGGREADCFVRNENDLGKPAWLDVGKSGGVFKSRPALLTNSSTTAFFRMPILSFERRAKFEIGDPNDGK
jgi:hypothetical protein